MLEPDVNEFLSKFDIVCLCETWLSDSVDNSDKIRLTGYNSRQFNRERIRLQGRHSGGLLIMWRERLDDHISFIDTSSEYIYFKIGNDPFVFSYIAPPDSTQLLQKDDPMNKLQATLFNNRFENLRYFGDLNARSGNLQDADFDVQATIPVRQNQDKSVNAQGRRLINICKACFYCIANGRIGNTSETSQFTYRTKNGNSVIDYLLVPVEYLASMNDLRLYDRVESDHVPISYVTNVTLKISEAGITRPNARDSETAGTPGGQLQNHDRQVKYMWRPEKADLYRQELTRQLINVDCGDIDSAVTAINRAIHESAADMKMSREPHRLQACTNKRHGNDHPWFDEDCVRTKKEVVDSFKTLLQVQSPTNQMKYNENKRKYVKLKRMKRRTYNNNYVRELLTNKRQNSKLFWKKFQWKPRPAKLEATKNDLQAHFIDVFENTATHMDPEFDEHLADYNTWWKDNGDEQTSDILDAEITEAEIEINIKKLKSGKSPGIDNLIPEFFKSTKDILVPTLKALFNEMLQTGDYPTFWQHQLLTPIYKKGNVTDTNNYRGISLISVSAKIFLNIMYTRIETFSNRNNLIPEEQVGFKKGRWTIDNAFTLYCYIKAAISKKNGHLYALFVDYSKCFDSISRNGLWYKLIKLGFSRKCVKILMSMYSNVSLYLKYDGVIGEEIHSYIGLKQGCPLSAILYSLYSIDIVTKLKKNLRPEQLLSPNVLMFADDTVIFSECVNTMKILIQNFEEYTKKWGLKVNLQKTKLLLFRNRKTNTEPLLVDFHFNSR